MQLLVNTEILSSEDHFIELGHDEPALKVIQCNVGSFSSLSWSHTASFLASNEISLFVSAIFLSRVNEKKHGDGEIHD